MDKHLIQPELIALADYAITSEDKKLSVMGIFDKIFVQQVPMNYPKLSFVAILRGKPHQEAQVKLRALSPANEELFSALANIKFGDNGKANMISNLEGFPFPEVGEYLFIIEQEGRILAEYPLEVMQLNAPGVKKLVS